jgi:hypothetical protein
VAGEDSASSVNPSSAEQPAGVRGKPVVACRGLTIGDLDARALCNGWGLTGANREAGIRYAISVLENESLPHKLRLAALSGLIRADSVDVRREAILSRERRSQLDHGVLLLREALQLPEIREALRRLTQQAIQGTQQAPEGQNSPSDDESPSQPPETPS